MLSMDGKYPISDPGQRGMGLTYVTCASAASVWGSQKVISMARYSRWRSAGRHGPAPADRSGHTACRDHGGSGPAAGACRVLGQSQGLLVVGFGLRNVGRVGVGMDDAKLVQRGLVPAFLALPGQVERLARVLPGLRAASR